MKEGPYELETQIDISLKILSFTHPRIIPNIYIYTFSRCFYPKQLTVHSGYTFFFIRMCVPWELNPRPFALLTQCSTTEPQKHKPIRL